MPQPETTPRDLPPKLAPTQRILAARGDAVKCVCGRPAISCGYCSAECLEADERAILGVPSPWPKDPMQPKTDGSLASPTPNARRELFALGTVVDGVPKLLNVQLHGPDSFIVWTDREAAEDYKRRSAAGDGYAVVEVK